MYSARPPKLTHTTRPGGFTIVEILIVIVVIGILAIITVVAYNGVQDRARAVAISKGFKQIDEGFKLMAIKDNVSTWWLDELWWVDEGPSYTGPHDPYVKNIIADTNLKNYLPKAPEVRGLDASVWRYDNDGNIYNPTECIASSSGVNVFVTDIGQSIAQMVDKMMDDGNLSCGAVRYNPSSNNRLLYSISYTQNVLK